MMIQNCNFLATHVDARSWNGDFLLSSLESSRCAASWQTRFWKLYKMKIKKSVDLRNHYANMVVFGFELFIFWSWFRIWTWKYRFPKFLKISFFPSIHTVHLHAWGGEAAEETIMKSSFLAWKSYQNINFDQIKNRDINLMIIYLIFYQNCNFLATREDARSWNGDFLLSSLEISRCAASWETWFWKLKLRSNKLVDLRNLYPKMVVFGFELLIFWSWFRIWTWKYRFPKFLKISFFTSINTMHLYAWGGEAAEETIMKSSFLAWKSYQNINFDQIKNRDINLMIIYLIFYQNCNFLATHVDARSWNGGFLLSSVESSR